MGAPVSAPPEIPRQESAWRRLRWAIAMAAMLGAFWIWVFAIQRLHIETIGLAGFVTATLWSLYFIGVPLAGSVTVTKALIGAVRHRHSWRLASFLIVFVTAGLAFWWWSVWRAGM